MEHEFEIIEPDEYIPSNDKYTSVQASINENDIVISNRTVSTFTSTDIVTPNESSTQTHVSYVDATTSTSVSCNTEDITSLNGNEEITVLLEEMETLDILPVASSPISFKSSREKYISAHQLFGDHSRLIKWGSEIRSSSALILRVRISINETAVPFSEWVYVGDTIWKLKKRLGAVLGGRYGRLGEDDLSGIGREISPGDFEVVYKGKVMKDCALIGDYALFNDSLLHIVLCAKTTQCHLKLD